MYFVKTPEFISNLFPSLTWKIKTADPVIFLTFDDGPIPEVTPWVMDTLRQYNAKGTFFCVGENAVRYPELVTSLRQAGHTVGNHTFNHLNGWKTDNTEYFRNVRKASHALHTELFRPPYGRIKPSQAKFLNRHYRVVMWDILSGDFDPQISKEQCLKNVLTNTSPGSVIVFHDSLKAKDKLEYVLPRVLDYFSAKGYRFECLSESKVLAGKKSA